MSDTHELNDFETRLLANVERAGCHINVVSDPDSGMVPYAYSIGFPVSVNQPEVIAFGLPSELAAYLINAVLEGCRQGLELEPGMQIQGIIPDRAIVMNAVDPSWLIEDYFNSALWFARRNGGTMDRAVQLIWPDAQGYYPWDADAPEELRRLQPDLNQAREN